MEFMALDAAERERESLADARFWPRQPLFIYFGYAKKSMSGVCECHRFKGKG
jgi:hypothetical protein